MGRSLVLVCALLPACSFIFVKDPSEASRKDPSIPVECTSANTLPLIDLFIGAVLGGFVAGTTYHFVHEASKDCAVPGACSTGVKPAILGTFLVVSPFWISSAVGFSDTHGCRKLLGSRGWTPPP